MKFQHDSYENEQNAGRAHFAMKWGYRGHNLMLMAMVVGLTCIPMVRHKYPDDPLWSWVNVLVLINVGLCLLGIWINGEAAQWHARATDDHYSRAEKLKPEAGFPDVEEHAAKHIPRRLNLDPQKARGAHA